MPAFGPVVVGRRRWHRGIRGGDWIIYMPWCGEGGTSGRCDDGGDCQLCEVDDSLVKGGASGRASGASKAGTFGHER